MEHDDNMMYDGENFFHVFARTGFSLAIHQVMSLKIRQGGDWDEDDDFVPDLYLTDCRNKEGNHPTMEAAKHNRSDALVRRKDLQIV